MNITIRQLRAFILGAERSSFSVAARKLGMTQPGYSLVIRQLEEELGVQLFQRTTRRVEFTMAGRDLLQSAQRTVQQLDETCRRAEDLRDIKRGTLRLTAAPSVACSLLPVVLAKFMRECPQISLVLFEDQAVDFAERLRSGNAEIGLGPPLPGNDELIGELLFSDRLVAVLDGANLLKQQPTVTWELLASMPYISVSTQSSVRSYADEAAARAGVLIEASYEVVSLAAAVGLVRAGLGYTVIPSVAMESLNLANLVVCVIEKPIVYRRVELVSRRAFTLSPSALAFTRFAREISTTWPEALVPTQT